MLEKCILIQYNKIKMISKIFQKGIFKAASNNFKKFQYIHSNLLSSSSKTASFNNNNVFSNNHASTRSIFTFSSVKVSHLINPYNKQLVSDKQYIADELIVQKINKVTQQQKLWKKLHVQERIQLVKNFVNGVLQDQQIITQIMVKEIGKSLKDIKQEFMQLRDQFPLLLTQGIDQLDTQVISQSDQGIVKIVPEPIGVTMIFPHFSQPIFDSMIHLIPCLVSGCGALVKSSDYNHALGPYLQRKVKQATGYQIIADLFIQPEDLYKLSDFKSLKKVVYSGSHTSAKHIFQVLTERRFIDCNMYFGGQDTIYVDQTANIDEAIDEVMRAAFSNNGQAYDSIKRLYIKESVYEQVINILKEKILQIKLGDPSNPQTDLGPLAIQQAASNLQQLVNEAISLGAKCQVGGLTTQDEGGSGIFFQPTLLTDLTNQMPILQTHSPAPILCCFCVSSDDDFLDNFNDNRFGARVKIFTKQDSARQIYARYEYLINNLEVGSIIINKGSVRRSSRRLQSWRASTNNRKSSSRSYEEYTIPKVFDI